MTKLRVIIISKKVDEYFKILLKIGCMDIDYFSNFLFIYKFRVDELS